MSVLKFPLLSFSTGRRSYLGHDAATGGCCAVSPINLIGPELCLRLGLSLFREIDSTLVWCAFNRIKVNRMFSALLWLIFRNLRVKAFWKRSIWQLITMLFVLTRDIYFQIILHTADKRRGIA